MPMLDTPPGPPSTKRTFFGVYATPCKISESLDNPMWEKSDQGKEKERSEKKLKNTVYSEHYVPYATPKGSARTSLGPKPFQLF